jgi:hypothetical protein
LAFQNNYDYFLVCDPHFFAALNPDISHLSAASAGVELDIEEALSTSEFRSVRGSENVSDFFPKKNSPEIYRKS